MAVYKVPTDILEACKKELKILSSDFELARFKNPEILKKDFESYRKKKARSKQRAQELIKLLEDNYGV